MGTLDATYLIVTIAGTALTTYVGVWATLIRPRNRERKRLAQVEAERQRRRDEFIDGIPAIPGMTDGVLSAAERLKNAADAITVLAKRVDETNGTGRRTEGKVDLLLAAFPEIEVPVDLKKY